MIHSFRKLTFPCKLFEHLFKMLAWHGINISMANSIKHDLRLLTTEEISWSGSDWIKGNVGQKGFYRVNYDDNNWDALAKAFRSDHKVTHSENY